MVTTVIHTDKKVFTHCDFDKDESKEAKNLIIKVILR